MAVAETVVKAEAPSLAEVPAERTAVVVLGERGVAPAQTLPVEILTV